MQSDEEQMYLDVIASLEKRTGNLEAQNGS